MSKFKNLKMDGDKNFNKAINNDPKFDEVYGNPKSKSSTSKKRFSLNDPPPNKNVQKKKKKKKQQSSTSKSKSQRPDIYKDPLSQPFFGGSSSSSEEEESDHDNLLQNNKNRNFENNNIDEYNPHFDPTASSPRTSQDLDQRTAGIYSHSVAEASSGVGSRSKRLL